jgi:hypothetical protein
MQGVSKGALQLWKLTKIYSDMHSGSIWLPLIMQGVLKRALQLWKLVGIYSVDMHYFIFVPIRASFRAYQSFHFIIWTFHGEECSCKWLRPPVELPNVQFTTVTTISDYHANHSSWLLIQLTATAVKQTTCESILLCATWWWSYDRNILWQ